MAEQHKSEDRLKSESALTRDQEHSIERTRTGMKTTSDARVTSSSTMAQSDDEPGVFDFFGLPRELRDHIYDDFLTGEPDIKLKTDRYRPHTTIQYAMTARLARVCCQFTAECRDRVPHNTWLLLNDNEFGIRKVSPPSATTNISKLGLGLVVVGRVDHQGSGDLCFCHDELDQHRQWITELVGKQQCVRSLIIELYSECEEIEAILDHHSTLTTIDHLTSLQVHCFAKGVNKIFDFTQPSKLVMKWSREDPELKRVEEEVVAEGAAVSVE
ncbi:hypothetical protein LTR08_006566 [Meristemomyces frigidus]|nr:hypothetical protein LTR08_006566 [Meristemomyces frigidus]